MSVRQRNESYSQRGNIKVTTSGIVSSSLVEGSYPGCTVTVYLAGTLTLATIYSDDNGTPKANPFTAGTDGLWFYYADDGDYDITFSGAGITAPFTLGDQQNFDYRFLQSGTGAVARTMKNKVGEVISLKDFGAKGDGVTDDTTALTNAIAASGFGKSLYIPPGVYITGPQTIPNDFTMWGDSPRLAAFRAKAGSTGAFFTDQGNAAGIWLVGLQFDGNNEAGLTDILKLGVAPSIEFGTQGLISSVLVRKCPNGNGANIRGNVAYGNAIEGQDSSIPIKLSGEFNTWTNIASVGGTSIGIDDEGTNNTYDGVTEVENPSSGAVPFNVGHLNVTVNHLVVSLNAVTVTSLAVLAAGAVNSNIREITPSLSGGGAYTNTVNANGTLYPAALSYRPAMLILHADLANGVYDTTDTLQWGFGGATGNKGIALGTYNALTPPVGGAIMPGPIGVGTSNTPSKGLNVTTAENTGTAANAVLNTATLAGNAIATHLDVEQDITNNSSTGSTELTGMLAGTRYRGSASLNSGNARDVNGVYGIAFNYNTGTTNFINGFYSDVRNNGAGTITNLAAFHAPSPNIAAGAVTNYFAFRAAAISGTSPANPWSFYAVDGSGRAYFGDSIQLRLSKVPIFANNAAALGGGLVVGQVYRTGADPDVLCIVH